MLNPILQMLNGNQMNSILGRVNSIKAFMNGQDPNAVFNQLMSSNPEFSKFVNENKNKTPEQIAKDYGLDPTVLNNFAKL